VIVRLALSTATSTFGAIQALLGLVEGVVDRLLDHASGYCSTAWPICLSSSGVDTNRRGA
jgi:hypothetical protein